MLEKNPADLSVEVELKYRLTGKNPIEAILKVLHARDAHLQVTELFQTNAFFDTEDYALRQANISLRLRQQNQDYFFTVKGNPEATHDHDHVSENLEYEIAIEPELAQHLLEGQLNVMDFLQHHPIHNVNDPTRLYLLPHIQKVIQSKPVGYVGSFTNLRRAVPVVWHNIRWVLELDKTDFPCDVTDEELELEVSSTALKSQGISMQDVHVFLQQLFEEAGVEVETINGKAERFFELLALPKRPVSDTKGPPSFVVPKWVKGAFFWVAFALIIGLVYSQIEKRITYRQLFIAHLMQAAPKHTQAPPFELTQGPNGKPFSLQGSHGSWRLVHFWATWCPICVDEMPSLIALEKRLGQTVRLITVSVDEDYNQVLQFFHHQAPAFPVLWDKNAQTARAYGVQKYPETFLISPDGLITAHFEGARPWNRQEAIDYLQRLTSTGIEK